MSEPTMNEPTREAAWDLLCEWTSSESLRRHGLAVEASMRAYARYWQHEGLGEEGLSENIYAITGLIHDLDYERHPDPETGHPRIGMAELERRGYPPEVIDAVAGHADYLGVPRRSRLARTLYAVDELSGFVMACAMVRPTGIEGMKVKSVRKKLKQPSFAAKVDREQIARGVEELGVEEPAHVGLVIGALEANAEELGISADRIRDTGG